jgi:hypothetical protein
MALFEYEYENDDEDDERNFGLRIADCGFPTKLATKLLVLPEFPGGFSVAGIHICAPLAR